MQIHHRRFGRTGWDVSEIGFGAWAIGGAWGDVSEADARQALRLLFRRCATPRLVLAGPRSFD